MNPEIAATFGNVGTFVEECLSPVLSSTTRAIGDGENQVVRTQHRVDHLSQMLMKLGVDWKRDPLVVFLGDRQANPHDQGHRRSNQRMQADGEQENRRCYRCHCDRSDPVDRRHHGLPPEKPSVDRPKPTRSRSFRHPTILSPLLASRATIWTSHCCTERSNVAPARTAPTVEIPGSAIATRYHPHVVTTQNRRCPHSSAPMSRRMVSDSVDWMPDSGLLNCRFVVGIMRLQARCLPARSHATPALEPRPQCDDQ